MLWCEEQEVEYVTTPPGKERLIEKRLESRPCGARICRPCAMLACWALVCHAEPLAVWVESMAWALCARYVESDGIQSGELRMRHLPVAGEWERMFRRRVRSGAAAASCAEVMSAVRGGLELDGAFAIWAEQHLCVGGSELQAIRVGPGGGGDSGAPQHHGGEALHLHPRHDAAAFDTPTTT